MIEGTPKDTDPQADNNIDSVYFTRHSRSTYGTYGKIKESDNPRAPVDREDQVVPDLPEDGIELANNKAREFFTQLNPEEDSLFFVSSDEARALETASIYKKIAKERGFEVLKPENVRGKLAEEIGDSEIRTLKSLSLNQKDALVAAVFSPDSQLGSPNWGAVDDEFKEKWARARAIINSHDYGSYGANLFHHSEAIAEIFPKIKTARELYEINFKNLLRLVKFAVDKISSSGQKKKVKILAFGHENYLAYALNKYFGEHEIKNCETLRVDVGEGEIDLIRRGLKIKVDEQS